MLTVFSSGLGPLLFARYAAVHHSYSSLLLILAGAVFTLGFVARTIRLPGMLPSR